MSSYAGINLSSIERGKGRWGVSAIPLPIRVDGSIGQESNLAGPKTTRSPHFPRRPLLRGPAGRREGCQSRVGPERREIPLHSKNAWPDVQLPFRISSFGFRIESPGLHLFIDSLFRVHRYTKWSEAMDWQDRISVDPRCSSESLSLKGQGLPSSSSWSFWLTGGRTSRFSRTTRT